MARLSSLDRGRPSDRKEDAIKAVQSDTESTIRMNANVPKSLHKQAKRYALEHDLTLTDLLIQVLEEKMSR